MNDAYDNAATDREMLERLVPPKENRTRCPGRARHWRIAARTVGMRTPVCIYCGSPNPRPLTSQEWNEIIDWANHHNVGKHVRQAIEERTSQESL